MSQYMALLLGCFMRMLLKWRFSPPPPRGRRVLKYIPYDDSSMSTSYIYTLRMPAAVSDPTVSPPAPRFAWQCLMTTFSVGRALSSPSIPRPAFSVKQSSPQSRVVYSMSALRDESMSMPSVRAMPWLSTVTPRMMMFSQYTGTMFQNMEPVNVTPSSRMFRQFIGPKKTGRQSVP